MYLWAINLALSYSCSFIPYGHPKGSAAGDITIIWNICSNSSGEYIGDTGVNKQKLRDRVRVYRQHIRQPQHQQLKIEECLRKCSDGDFKIFPFLQMRSAGKELRRMYELRVQLKFNTKLNQI